MCNLDRLQWCCRVVYFSIHRYEYGTFWPNLRESDYDYIGSRGKSRGFNVNVPYNKVCMYLRMYVCSYCFLCVRV